MLSSVVFPDPRPAAQGDKLSLVHGHGDPRSAAVAFGPLPKVRVTSVTSMIGVTRQPPGKRPGKNRRGRTGLALGALVGPDTDVVGL